MKLIQKKITSLFLVAALTASTGCMAFAADGTSGAGDVGDIGENSTTDTTDLAGTNIVSHIKYINGFEDGTLKPDKTLSHAEAVQMLYNLGISANPPEEAFNKSRDISRGDFAELVLASDDKLEMADILTGYPDGTLGLERTLTRAEAVTIINRALGRTADRFSIAMSNDIRVMPDVKDSHWAYYQLLEATTEHTCIYAQEDEESWVSHEPAVTGLSEGWKLIDGETYYVDETGMFLYNTTVNGLNLGANGRYSTGNAELDGLLASEVQKMTTAGMTQVQKLRAIYDYMMENYGYRGAGTVEAGSTGWEMDMAVDMLKSGKGNCYSWAAAYTYLARKAGYNAAAVAGTAVSPKGSSRDHAWTEIMIDGVLYTFDPEIEGVYAASTGDTYDLFMKKYGEAQWQYNKPEVEPDDGNVPDSPEEPGEDVALDENICNIMDSVYLGVYDYIASLSRSAVTSENEAYFLGTEGLDYKAGVASEPLMSSIAHSVVILEMNDGADIEAAKASIKSGADPNKWICVGVAEENVLVDNVGNYIILIMADKSTDLMTNFKAFFA